MFVVIVCIPTLLLSLYKEYWQTPMFTGVEKLRINTAPYELSNYGQEKKYKDTNYLLPIYFELKDFILSYGMLEKLDKQLSLKKQYSSKSIDYIKRLKNTDNEKALMTLYLRRVKVHLDDRANEIVLTASSHSPQMTRQLLDEIVNNMKVYLDENFGKKEEKLYSQAKMELEFKKRELINLSLYKVKIQQKMLDKNISKREEESLISQLAQQKIYLKVAESDYLMAKKKLDSVEKYYFLQKKELVQVMPAFISNQIDNSDILYEPINLFFMFLIIYFLIMMMSALIKEHSL